MLVKLLVGRTGAAGVQRPGQIVTIDDEAEALRMIDAGHCRAATKIDVATYEAQQAEAAEAAKVADVARASAAQTTTSEAIDVGGDVARVVNTVKRPKLTKAQEKAQAKADRKAKKDQAAAAAPATDAAPAPSDVDLDDDGPDYEEPGGGDE